MQVQLMVGVVVILLVVLYVYLKRNKGHQESNLPVVSQPNPPAVSEDVNLPTGNQSNPPMVSQNELDNNRPQ